jgi:hypothetical protein
LSRQDASRGVAATEGFENEDEFVFPLFRTLPVRTSGIDALPTKILGILFPALIYCRRSELAEKSNGIHRAMPSRAKGALAYAGRDSSIIHCVRYETAERNAFAAWKSLREVVLRRVEEIWVPFRNYFFTS